MSNTSSMPPGTSRYHHDHPEENWSDVVLPDGRIMKNVIAPHVGINPIETWRRTRIPQVLSHRGDDGYHCNGTYIPDNTFEAYKRALSVVSGFECDVVLTKDRQVLIMHNFHASRQTNYDRRWSQVYWDHLSVADKEVVQHSIGENGRYVEGQSIKVGTVVQTLDAFLKWKMAETRDAVAVMDCRNTHSIEVTAILSRYPVEQRKGVYIQVLNFLGGNGQYFVDEVEKCHPPPAKEWKQTMEFVVSPNKDGLHLVAGLEKDDLDMDKLEEANLKWMTSFADAGLNIVAFTIPIIGAWQYYNPTTKDITYPGISIPPTFTQKSFFAKDYILHTITDQIRPIQPNCPIIIPSTSYTLKDANGTMYRTDINKGTLIPIDMTDPLQRLTMLASLPQAPFDNGADIAMTDRHCDALYHLVTGYRYDEETDGGLDYARYNEPRLKGLEEFSFNQ